MKKIFFFTLTTFLLIQGKSYAPGNISISNLVTYNQNVSPVGDNEVLYEIHTAHINFKDQNGEFKPIDTTLSQNQDGWFHAGKASYAAQIPEFADGWIEFVNFYEGTNEIVKAKPICNHVKGEVFNNQKDGNYVLYKDAFAPGVDLKIYSYWKGLKEVVVFNSNPAKDYQIEFEIDIGSLSVKEKTSEWDKNSKLVFTDKSLEVGKSFFSNSIVWDSENIVAPVPIELDIKDGKQILRKTVKKEFFDKATFPVMTDHATDYFVGAGDGQIGGNNASWDTIHDATTATAAATAGGDIANTRNVASLFIINRKFLPVDTSGIADGDTVTAGTINLTVSGVLNGDNDGDDWINIVGQTSQADPTTLANGDFDQCGSINNPTEGATRIDLGSITGGDVLNTWTLNATGLGWVNKTGYSLFGVREGHDCIDSPIATNAQNGITYYNSEDSSGTKDPYLSVTTTAGATRRIISIT